MSRAISSGTGGGGGGGIKDNGTLWDRAALKLGQTTWFADLIMSVLLSLTLEFENEVEMIPVHVQPALGQGSSPGLSGGFPRISPSS